jgi:D-3-phosphoglycerate dehydrogenase
MNILIADKFEKTGIDGLAALGASVAYEPAAGAEGLGAAIERVRPDVLVVRSSKVPAAALQNASSLKVIIRAGAGVDNIEVPAATAKGISVCNCPGMNAVAVAELAMAHLLACDRRIVDQTVELRSGKWNKKEYAKARGLKGSTLGIVGLGAIGEAVAKRAQAFEMDVVGWSRSLTPAAASDAGIRFGGTDRAALLKMVGGCDAVSIHVALVPETKHLCNAEFFAAMKPGACFINTSRGGVVDEAALRDAVKAKGIRVGLDVYEGQPPSPQADFATPMAQVAGASLTHHCGASTDQAQAAVADEVVRIARVFKETGRVENCVNRKS